MLSALSPTNCIAAWVRRVTGVPAGLVLCEQNTTSLSSRGAPDWRGRIMPRLMRRAYQHADRIVAVSCGVADDLGAMTNIPPNRIEVIYNPAFTPQLRMLRDAPLEHPWFGPNELPVVLGVGRLTRQKDFPTLIRAMALVRRQKLVRLVILGEGEEHATLEALVRELGIEADVAIPGFVSNPFAYMRRAAMFVLSSAWEGFGNVLVEALACGTPVISTDCRSGPAEILEDGRWGRLVPVGRPDTLAGAILETLDEPRGRGEERAAHFSMERAVERYLAIMLDLGDA